MKYNSRDIARALIRKQAVEALQTMADFITKGKPSREDIARVRRARSQYRIIRDLKV